MKHCLLCFLFPLSLFAASPSGSLPLLEIKTENARLVLDKVTQIPATLTVTLPGNDPSTDTLSLTIRGRGNSSWKYSQKKPYKLKFNDKQPLLGMPGNRHFAALNYSDGYIPEILGMEAMRRLGAPWAPQVKPVEIVLNGDYIGMYFIAETVRAGKHRVNITKQPDGLTNPDSIPIGWLVEINNYSSTNRLIILEPGENNISLTPHSPEQLSADQQQWLRDEFNDIINSIHYRGDWTEKLNAESVARYFIVRELFHDTDAWRGSFYLHREDGLWSFGPLWDVLFTDEEKQNWTPWQHPAYAAEHHLIKPIMKTEIFWREVARLWVPFRQTVIPELLAMADEVAATCAQADVANAGRWEIADAPSAAEKAKKLKARMLENAAWMDAEISPYSSVDELPSNPGAAVEYFDLQGRRIARPARGICIMRVDGRRARTINIH